MRTSGRLDRDPDSLVFTSGDFAFVRAGEEHVPLLARWRSDPRVIEWYGGRDRPMDEAAVRAKYLGGSAGVVRCVVYHEDRPVGAAQFYPAPVDAEWSARLGIPDDAWGIDLFIGEPLQWGRGLGSSMARALARWLVEEAGAATVVLDVQTANSRAIAAYEKAGFRKRRLVLQCEIHEGEWRDCWLMEFSAGERPRGPRAR